MGLHFSIMCEGRLQILWLVLVVRTFSQTQSIKPNIVQVYLTWVFVSELSEKSFESTKIHHILLACMQCFNSKRLSSARYTYSAKNRQCIHTAVELIREVTEVHVLHMRLLLNSYTEDAVEFPNKLHAAWKHSLLTFSDILSKLVKSFSSVHCI